MKKFYFILSVLFLIACSKDQTVESKTDQLPGKSVITHSDGSFFASKTFIYDNNRLINIVFSNAQAENAGYAELIYTDDLLIKINQFDKNDNLTEYTELKYDSNNRLEQYTIYRNEDNTAFKNVLEYNSNNTITNTSYSGDIDNQTDIAGLVTYTLDSNHNITKIQTSGYQIVYEYDSKNGVFKNLVARDVLNLMGKLDWVVNRGGMNNAISYEFSNQQVTDHIDLNYTYNNNSYPSSVIEVSTEFGEGRHTEYIYN